MEILSGYLTPLIAILAAYIAWQQYKINKRRFLFETYEKRLKIYTATQDFLDNILKDGKAEYANIFLFSNRTSEVIFLFDKPIQDKIEEIFKKSIELHNLYIELSAKGTNELPIGEERNLISQKETKLLKWLINQRSVTKKMFAKRMALK